MTFAFLSLASPLLLWGAALAALPLIAHLLHRRARRRVIFPTIQFLRQSSASQSRLFKLRRWILLALRCLFVGLIAAAFARPTWFGSPQSERDSHRGTALVIVLDQSASTAQDAGGRPLFDALKGSAHRLLDGLRASTDVAGVVLASDRPAPLFPRLTPNLDALREQIRAQQPTFARADLPKAISAAEQLLATHAGRRRIAILSDLQRDNWKSDEGRHWIDLIPPGVEVTVIEPETAAPGNVALSAPRAAPPRPIVGQPAQAVVKIANHSAAAREVPLSMQQGQDAPVTQIVRLAPGEEREVGFALVFATHDERPLTFSIPEDALAADDRAALVVRPVRRLPALILSDEDPAEPGNGLYFLQRALAPLGTEEDRFDARVRKFADVTAKDLADAGVVFVEYVSPSPAGFGLLASHLRAGGSVVVFAADSSMTKTLQALNAALGSGGALPWAPGPIRDLTNVREPLTISGGQWRSRLLRDFDEQSQLALGQIRFHRVMSSSGAHAESEVLLTFSDGTPALASRPVGAGRLLVAAFSADVTSSDFGKFGAFVALTQLLARELRPPLALDGPGVVGQLWRRVEPAPAGNTAIRRIDPDGTTTAVPKSAGGEPVALMIEAPETPGLYRFERDGRPFAWAAVQIDPRESRLERLSKDETQRLLTSRGPTAKVATLDGASRSDDAGRPLWHWALAGALLAMALEMICLIAWPR